MIILGIILSVFAIGFFCWLLFTLAVYALPVYAALIAAFAAYHHGYGLAASALIAVLAGGATLAIGQIAFALARTRIVRAGIALTFAVPAAVAGYYATLGIAHILMASVGLGHALALIGAALVGGTAWTRMAIFVAPTAGRRVANGDVSSQAATAANG